MVTIVATPGTTEEGNIRSAGRELTRLAGMATELALVAGPVVFQAVIFLVQIRQPGYNPVRDTISSLVWGNGGWLQTLNFFLIGVFIIAVANMLRTRLAGKITDLMGCLSLALMGIGFIILGICPARNSGGPQTLPAMVHGVTVYCIILLFLAACSFLARALWVMARSRAMFVYTIATGTLCAVFIITGIFIMVTHTYWFGMLERVLLLNGFAWLEVVTYLALDRRAVKTEYLQVRKTRAGLQ